VLAARGGRALAAQGLEHEVALLRLLDGELDQRSGAHAQAGQGGAPRDDGAADEDPVGEHLADELDHHLGAVLELLRRRAKQTALGQVRLIQAPELLGALATDAENVQLFAPPTRL
jgi:hypothetical protein